MKTSTSLILTTLAALTQAQYSGFITTELRGSCPIPLREGDDTKYAWDPQQGDLCVKLDQADFYVEDYHASLIGYAETPEAVEPLKFGGCSDASCSECTLVDVRRREDRPGTIESDCVDFENAPFLFVGIPQKNDL
ncbi:hypothetical protein BDW62DRAFT_193460 [Aspergillus aurantiobrunneus]